ncbi:MAG: glycosyltransferase [Erysipelotrichaceae bacterium]|nr:glycosyltransferase [Erysipelotrichaceae bacterium]
MGLISVIIPVYKVEEYLERCLDSVINNTYKDLEIICVDDGSPDRCPLILERYANIDNRIKVIHKNNGGLSSARNAGMDIMTGDYVAFIDSDDWIHPLYFELLMNNLMEKAADLVICDYQRVYENKNPDKYDDIRTKKISIEDILSEHKLKGYVWGKLYKKELLNGNQFSECTKVEDAFFNIAIYSNHPHLNAVYIDVPLYYYFVRQGSLITKFNGTELIELASSYEQLIHRFDNLNVQKLLCTEILKRCLSARYTFSVRNEKDRMPECQRMMKSALFELKKNKQVSFKEILKYQILFSFPLVYRLFRIIDDPTMLDWERNQKRLRNSK